MAAEALEEIKTIAGRSVRSDLIDRAYQMAEQAHAGQKRGSGEPFIIHPLAVAKTIAEMGLDEATIAAALLHDVVEDSNVSVEEITTEFGDEVARLVAGVTKLTRIHLQSREHAEAANYRKMVIAMAEDVRVIVIKLADRLHNMRTIEYLGKEKQIQKATETLEVYAPLASRLGMFAFKWELEDLSFHILHPRRYAEIEAMINDRREVREQQIVKAKAELEAALAAEGIVAEVAGRAKHLYSIYDKMTRKGREFNEIYDLIALRVIVDASGEDGARCCYAVLGVVHALWKPIPGRFKDYIAMPKFNLYQSLHTTVVRPEGRPLEVQIRTREMHETSEFGVAAHWIYKEHRQAAETDLSWLKRLADTESSDGTNAEFMQQFRSDLFSDEVFAFTPQGDVKTLPAGATPIDFAYAIHTDVGHRMVGAKVNGRIVPLASKLQNGDIVEILTSKQQDRGPSRDWLNFAVSSRARLRIRRWLTQETREETETSGREQLESALKAHNLPFRKLQGSPVLAQVMREMGFRKADDLYLAIAGGKVPASTVASKIVNALRTSAVDEDKAPLLPQRPRRTRTSDSLGIHVPGSDDVLIKLAKCCTPVPGDPVIGYISMGQGITVHREDCPNVKQLRRSPERLIEVEWDGESNQSFLVEIAVHTWDRPRLLEDMARTFSDHGASIIEYGGRLEDGIARNWYLAEIGDLKSLRSLLTALRSVDDVFDAYRVTPS